MQEYFRRGVQLLCRLTKSVFRVTLFSGEGIHS